VCGGGWWWGSGEGEGRCCVMCCRWHSLVEGICDVVQCCMSHPWPRHCGSIALVSSDVDVGLHPAVLSVV
jgi:hypothetical protein